jgi:type VI secretion system protein VasG
MQLDMKTLVGKLNRPCRKALESAAHLALNQTHYYVEVEHYLLKLFEMADTDLLVVVRQYDVDLARIVKELSKAVDGYGKGNGRTPSLSPVINDLLQGAWTFASLKLGAPAIRSGAILQATLDHEEIVASLHKKAPTVANIYRERMRVDLPDLIGISKEEMPTPVEASKEAARSARERAAAARQETESEDEPETEEEFERRDTPALDQFTVSLTEQAAVGLTDPIIGRDSEIRQIIDILMRRRQNNPILTGEAGVGKTAVVEGFAQRVAVGDVPPPLQDVDVRALDLGLLQAGAGVKGEFEERLKNVIAEVQGSAQPIVLFIDEAHTLIGAGGAAGSGDAANLLKPALARGDLRTIAATTWSEYKKYVEKDPALARRFQVVKVDEPSEDQAVDMLRGLALRLEEHHKVRILDEALQEATRLSARYISGRYLPDKAIGVLDTACARVAVAQNAQPAAMEAAVRRAERLTAEIEILIREEATGWDHNERIEKLKTQIEAAESDRRRLQECWEKERGVVEEISNLLATGEGGKANTALKEMQAKLALLQGDDPMVPSCVDGNVIAQVVAGWTGIPVGRMMRDEIDAVLNLETRMGERIVGQNHAVGMVAERIRTYHASLGEPGKPIGVFLFAGPSGVGKTETALTLSELLYGGERNLITINMSEYQEAHTVSNLKGAPPGYVGYGQGGVLTEAVRRNPYAVVLLDEVEKAHPDVMELFYQVFDKGRLEDAEGIEVDFKNTIIIMTSNLGTDIIASSVEAGEKDPAALAEKVRPALLRTFKPALLGRLNVVPYLPLNDEEIRAIVALKLNKIQVRYEENHGAVMSISKKVADAIVARCTEVESGARNIDQIINQRILPHLSEEILKRMAGEVPVGSVKLTLIKNGEFHFAFEKS